MPPSPPPFPPNSPSGSVSYAALIVTINVRLLMCADFLTVWHWVSFGLSIGIWFVLVLIYDAIPPSSSSLASQVSAAASSVGPRVRGTAHARHCAAAWRLVVEVFKL